MVIESNILRIGSNSERVIIPDSVNIIAEMAFFRSKVTYVLIPNSVEKIGQGAFCACQKLTEIELPNSISIIDGWVFDGCTNLVKANIPNSLIKLGNHAFNNCTSLKQISINGLNLEGHYLKAFINWLDDYDLSLQILEAKKEDLPLFMGNDLDSLSRDMLEFRLTK